MSIPNNVDSLLSAAAHAESTGQPRLCALYMRKAESLAERERRESLSPIELAWEDFRTNVSRAFESVRGQLGGLS